MRRTHPTRDPWEPCAFCRASGVVDGDYDGRDLRCPPCEGTGYTLRPTWRIYRPRRTR